MTMQLKLLDDPWSLSYEERHALLRAMRPHQDHWNARLCDLTEPPPVTGEFPAFLLETAAFAHLKAGIGIHGSRLELPTATADELQRFVDHYRGYMVAPDPSTP